MSSKELKTSIVLSQNGTIDYTKFMKDVDKWSKKALPAKWVVKVYQDLTREQRAYFHGVIIPHVIRVLADETGSIYTRSQVKEYLKKEFCPLHTKSGWNEDGEEEVFSYIPSTEDLSKEEYSELIDNCLKYCIDTLGHPCPEPRG